MITVLQVLLLRQHNRICSHLKEINPSWDDERLYQEARKIVIAQIQHITYNHWLGIIVGEKAMKKWKLYSKGDGYEKGYKPEINPSTYNEFATSCFRYLHTLIPSELEMCEDFGKCEKKIKLGTWMNRSDIVHKDNNLDEFCIGLQEQKVSSVDHFLSYEVTNNLFKGRASCGQDLAAADSQRGRDNGLAVYNCYREWAGLKRAKTHDEFKKEIPGEGLKILANLYESSDDVDFFVGSTLEKHVKGTLIGPTCHLIISEQFYNWKYGDRYFYTFEGSGAFSPARLKALQVSSLSDILCRNCNGIKEMPKDSFRPVSKRNPTVPCSEIPTLDLTLWKE